MSPSCVRVLDLVSIIFLALACAFILCPELGAQALGKIDRNGQIGRRIAHGQSASRRAPGLLIIFTNGQQIFPLCHLTIAFSFGTVQRSISISAFWIDRAPSAISARRLWREWTRSSERRARSRVCRVRFALVITLDATLHEIMILLLQSICIRRSNGEGYLVSATEGASGRGCHAARSTSRAGWADPREYHYV